MLKMSVTSQNLIFCPSGAVIICALISFLSLTAALLSQLVWDLSPCQMCIYQRIPFLIVLLLSFLGAFCRDPKAINAVVGGNFLLYVANALLAFYHTGIEQRWWQETQGCKVNFDFDASNAQSLMEKISSAQAHSCATIPWQDPLIGLSMANYNILLCLAMAVYCGFVVLRSKAGVAL